MFTGYRGESVLITISKSSIKIVLERTGVVICDHYIENISFASGGEKVLAFSLSDFSLEIDLTLLNWRFIM